MRSQSWRIRRTAIASIQAGAIVVMGCFASPVQAQFPLLKDLNLQPPKLLEQKSDTQVVSGCIRLDGRCLFKIADQKSDLPNRIDGIEQRLNDITRVYFKNDSSELKIRKRQEANLPNIYISVGNKEVNGSVPVNSSLDGSSSPR